MFLKILQSGWIVFLIFGGVSNLAAQTQGTPYESKEFIVRPGVVVKVKSISGNVVVKGTEGSTVRVELYVKKGLSFFQRGQSIDDANILIFQRDNEIVADIQSKRSDAWTQSNTQYHFVISVPNRSSCQISTSGGNIELSNVDGSHMLKTAGGDILIERTSGDVKAYSTGGAIRGEDIRGVVFAQSVGGNIDLNGVSGETRFRVTGGNLALHRMNGTIIGETNGGNIKGDILSILHGLDLAVAGGNIDLTIPGMVGMSMNVRGNRVIVNRLRNFDGEIKTNSLVGSINGGGLPVKLRSSGGTVDLIVTQDRP